MPYDSIEELPENVRKPLPEDAQKIFKEAFNNAWDQYEDPADRKGDVSRETVAIKVAWSAVKNRYRKDQNGNWVKR